MTASPAGDPSDSERARDSRTTTWMIVAGVLALVAIGLGIWGFTTNSKLNDANDTSDSQSAEIKRLEQQLASQEQRSTQLRAFGDRERAAFRRVKRRFIREKAQERMLRGTIQKEAQELQAARTEAANAESQDQRDKTALAAARQEAQLAKACVQGAVIALDRFSKAPTARAGANAAVAELQSIQDSCSQAN